MKTINHTLLLPNYIFILFLIIFTSCEKSKVIEPNLELDIPARITINYGSDSTLDLSKELADLKDVSIKLSFEETQNINISPSLKLQDLLKQAVKFDIHKRSLIISSRLLYPNNSKSVLNNQVIPSEYKVKLIFESSKQVSIGESNLSLVINPANVSVKGAIKDQEQQYSYALFSEKETLFELEKPTWAGAETNWYLPKTDNKDMNVSLNNNLIKFAGTTGNLTEKEETFYDLEPTLIKDGYPIASNKFKVIFIPEIKFLYGTYYPDLNLSVKYNYLHVWLNEGYTSKAPSLYPEKYKSKFSIIKIEKDNVIFSDTQKVFEINENTGVVTSKAKNTLTSGSYKLTIKATTTTGIELITTLTLVSDKD